MRHSQGKTAEEKTLRRWLLERYPSSPEAVDVLWTRGTEAEARGDPAAALKSYAALVRHAPDRARAGEARMRTAQIELGMGRVRAAVRVYRDYLARFPEGRRWDEAAYWEARLDLQLGDTAVARHLVARIRRAEPVSYYAVVGAALLNQSYHVDMPAGEPAVEPPWLAPGLQRLDLLRDAGLKRGADAEESRLVARARGSRSALFSVAEALIERGRTVAGINLGWDLRREGEPWSRRLLKVVYPFPYQELVRREAAEWGLDPIMLAALIRQESAFATDIVSGAGAVGLMQVMPPTGRQLARAHGPRGFEPASLTTPEVNLHLGAAFFVEMSQRYDGDLPLVLAAYNAGPTRATRWQRFAEAADPLRFTERIPIDETRGYVKNVTRNVSVYQALYGAQ
jgi:soluble lytic murein transglycosylase